MRRLLPTLVALLGGLAALVIAVWDKYLGDSSGRACSAVRRGLAERRYRLLPSDPTSQRSNPNGGAQSQQFQHQLLQRWGEDHLLSGPAQRRPEAEGMENIEVEPSEITAAIYAETGALYEDISPQLKNGAVQGYKILYGPLLVEAPLFFLGTQVGGVAADQRANERETWPDVTEYATADWMLARKLREVFEVGFLKRCTGTNINFFRARNAATYKREVPADLRERCEGFSRDCAGRLVKAINPEKIVVIGFDVIKKLKVDRQFVRMEEGVQRGNLWGIPAIAVWHLTGTRMTTEQRIVIRRALREFAEMNPK
jgi:hypothetical protein